MLWTRTAPPADHVPEIGRDRQPLRCAAPNNAAWSLRCITAGGAPSSPRRRTGGADPARRAGARGAKGPIAARTAGAASFHATPTTPLGSHRWTEARQHDDLRL